MRKLLIGLGILLGWTVAGCDQTEQIRHYQVPKSIAIESPKQAPAESMQPGESMAPSESPPPAVGKASPSASPQRMLAALVLQADRAWFFKTLGAPSAVGEQADAFRKLVKSLRFADGKPQWDLPAGWRQKGESGMRFATLEFGSTDSPLELTVIPLPIPPGDRAAYVLSNVNRWRQQVNLPPITTAELDGKSEKVELDGVTAVMVDLHGE